MSKQEIQFIYDSQRGSSLLSALDLLSPSPGPAESPLNKARKQTRKKARPIVLYLGSPARDFMKFCELFSLFGQPIVWAAHWLPSDFEEKRMVRMLGRRKADMTCIAHSPVRHGEQVCQLALPTISSSPKHPLFTLFLLPLHVPYAPFTLIDQIDSPKWCISGSAT